MSVKKCSLVMTRWFVDDDIAERATSTSYRILETEVEVVPENVPAACTDENVNILAKTIFYD